MFAKLKDSLFGLVPRAQRLKVTILASHNLGEAWSGNTINTAIFRHHGVLSSGNRQFTAFYVNPQTLRVVRRDLDTDEISLFDLSGDYNLLDAHNGISLGVDREGHVHLCYDHHSSNLHYRRSLVPHDITRWTEELEMTGFAEDEVSYPTFILPRQGFPLTFLYRDGFHDRGVARMKTYDERSQSWADHPVEILSGVNQSPWTSNAYWNHPAVGSDGSLHLSFVWRTVSIGEERLINNINICYARSLDNGLTWETSYGRPYRLPITQANVEVVHAVSPGRNLINQCGMSVDEFNNPRIAFYSDDCEGVPQYQHLLFDGKRWMHKVVSKRTGKFVLSGGGTLKIPISRPELITDKNSSYLIYRGDLTGDRLVIHRVASGGGGCGSNNDMAEIWADDLGHYEPVIDRVRWERAGILSLLIQKNEQPNHDVGHKMVANSVILVDVEIK